MRLIDTHCHLNDTKAFPDPGAAVEEAQAAGVEKLVVVGIDTESSRLAVELAERFEPVYAVVGWHPTHTSSFSSEELEVVGEMLEHPKVVALGEIGLDYHWDYATREEQYRALEAQLDLAEARGVPVVFHCREAEGDLLDVLERRAVRVPYLFHCFAGSAEDAARGLALGGVFGVDGPITFKSRDDLRGVVKGIGLERMVVETDAPWMTPVPYRGQRNRPAWVALVNEGLAGVFGISAEECALATTRNAERFFGF